MAAIQCFLVCGLMTTTSLSMYSMIRRQVAKPAVLHVNQLARATYHGKVQSQPTKGDDEYFVNASFRDDFESSFSKADILESKANAAKESAVHGTPAQAQTKPGEAQSPAAQSKKSKEVNRPVEREREPELDEM